MLVCRSTEPLTQDIRDKIALFADVDIEAVISASTSPTSTWCRRRSRRRASTDSSARARPRRAAPPTSASGTSWSSGSTRRAETVEIALVGKYVKLHDAYLSVHEALQHAGIHNGCNVEVDWVDAEK